MKGFTFFENFFDSISDPRNGLLPEQEAEVYRAILYYVFRGEELPLEGAGRMAFNLIRPSLDISRTRSEARRAGASKAEDKAGTSEEEEGDRRTSNENQNGIKRESNPNQKRIKSEKLTFLEEAETETETKETRQNAPAGAREGDETDGTEIPEVAAYKAFLAGHPEILVDITNPGLICGVDWALLDKKIGESRILKPKRSLNWLIGHYREIVGDSYRDFDRSPPGEDKETELRREAFLSAHPWMREEEGHGDG